VTDRRAIRTAIAAAVALLASGAALAAEPASAAAPAAAVPSVAGGLGQMILSLAVVLGLIGGLAWLARRMRGIATAVQPGVDVVASTAVGARERVVLVRVHGRLLVLGVAPGNVRALADLEDTTPPAVVAPAVNAPDQFATILRRSLGLKS